MLELHLPKKPSCTMHASFGAKENETLFALKKHVWEHAQSVKEFLYATLWIL